MEQFERTRRSLPWLKRITPQRVWRRLRATATGQPPRSFIDLVNEDLLRSGVITKPLTDSELWSVTDIHIYNGKGISLQTLGQLLPGYAMVSKRSYSFFGEMYSELAPHFQREEDRLLQAGAPNGLHIAAVWRKVNGSTNGDKR